MKKKHYLMMALVGLLAAATFSACSKDDDEGSGDLYRPSQDMSSEEILTLFEEVTANMATVRQVSLEGTTTGKRNGMTMSASMMAQIDFDAKKEVVVEYGVDRTIGRFQYVENVTAYGYESANYNYDGKEIKHSYKVSDAYWNRMADVSELESAFNLEWEVKNSTFTGSRTEFGVLMKMTVTITPSKRIAGIKIESSYQDESTTVEFKYSYAAVNPVPPAGFTLSEFPPAQQYSVKVVWGEGLGESTFYTEPSSIGYCYLEEIIECAPAVSGKVPVLYRDSNFTQSITGSSITVTNNNTVIYVKWEASASAKKSASKPAAKKWMFDKD
jgi:hypothetical protein